MEKLKSLLKDLLNLNGVSGNEESVSEYIINKLKSIKNVTFSTDNLGNIIVLKKGTNNNNNNNNSQNSKPLKVLFDAHMDEVGVIVTGADSEGFLTFSTIGGISPESLCCAKINLNGVLGVIGTRPFHLLSDEEKNADLKKQEFFIDIGALNKEEAENTVPIGTVGTFIPNFDYFGINSLKQNDETKAEIKENTKKDKVENEDMFISKAIDDRAGAAVLLRLLEDDSLYDFYVSFSVQEEIGSLAAGAVSYSVNPDIAFIIESTTAADILGNEGSNKVCVVGKGPAISFMDHSSLYNKKLYNLAFKQNVPCQPKSFVSGGNNSSSFGLYNPAKLLAISLPTRYLHSKNAAASFNDLKNLYFLTKKMLYAVNEENLKNQ